MKNHIHRLLIVLPRLCKSELVKHINVGTKGAFFWNVQYAYSDATTLFLMTKPDTDSPSPPPNEWIATDREGIRHIEVVLDDAACAAAGIDTSLHQVLVHLESELRRERKS